MNTKHTPGPWKVRTNVHKECNGDSWGWVSPDTLSNISLPGISIHWTGGTGLANAKLIAAAPELLEALIQVRKLIGPYDSAFNEVLPLIDAAITKAI